MFGGLGGEPFVRKSNPTPRPRLLMCYICGREFGSKSLSIHIPQCQIKFKQQQQLLPREQRRPLPKPPPTFGSGFGGGGGAIGGKMTQEQMDAQNDVAYSQYKENLSPCPNCGRKFASDRLPIHLKSCKPGHVLTPLTKSGAAGGSDSIPAQTKSPVAPSVSSKAASPRTNVKNANEGGGNGGGSGGGSGGGGAGQVECDVCHQKFPGGQILTHYQSHFVECDMCHNKFPSTEILGHYKTHFGGGGTGTSGSTGAATGSGSRTPSPAGTPRATANTHPSSTGSNNSSGSGSKGSYSSEGGGSGDDDGDGDGEDGDDDGDGTLASYSSSPAAPAPKSKAAGSAPAAKAGTDAVKAPDTWASTEDAEGGGEGGEEGNEVLVPCGKCGRKFLADRIAKHQKVCRGPTNTPKAHSTEIPDAPTEAQLGAKAAGEKKAKWRTDHEALMAGLRAARLVTKYQKEGRSLADLPPPPPTEHPDYRQCPHCGRKFAPDVYERHAPRCATTQNKPAPPSRINRFARKK